MQMHRCACHRREVDVDVFVWWCGLQLNEPIDDGLVVQEAWPAEQHDNAHAQLTDEAAMEDNDTNDGTLPSADRLRCV